MSMNNFIMTSDEETAKILMSEGFNCIQKDKGKWVFINNNESVPILSFNNKNVLYTNKLCI